MATAGQFHNEAVTTSGKANRAKAAPPIFPFPGHRTLHVVDVQAALHKRNLHELRHGESEAVSSEPYFRAHMRRANDNFLAALAAAR